MAEYTVTTTATPVVAGTAASTELDRAIIDASREYIAAQRTRPRDQARIDDAKDALDALIELRNAGL
jgi:hypothetical protein